MIYILEEDLELLKQQHIIDQFSSDSDRIIEACELFAISMIKAYVGTSYDIDAMITAPNRNFFLVRCLLDIMMYDLATRVSSIQMSILIQDRYEKTISFLRDAGAGKLQLNWITFDEDEVQTSSFKVGSVEPYI